MHTSSSKKQNRILIISLVLLLMGATMLVAIVTSANRRHSDSPLPLPTETSENTNGSDDPKKETLPGNDGGEKSPTASDGKENTTPSDGEPNDNTDQSTPTFSESGALPKFSSPIKDSVMTKEYSGTSPVFSYTMNDYRTHNGIDIACEAGTSVYAAADGEILFVSDDPMMGVTVCIKHSGGAVSKYMGLSKESLTLNAVGTVVKAGDVIGTAGDTALIESAEDPHIHFELTVGGELKDPTEYFDIPSISDVFED